VRFLILRQKFLEILEASGAAEAMVCLREELAPLEDRGLMLVPPREPKVCLYITCIYIYIYKYINIYIYICTSIHLYRYI